MKEKKKKTRLEKVFKIFHWLDRHVLSLIFPYEVHGNLTKYNEGPLIIIGNHYHYFDVLLSLKVTDRPIRYLAKRELRDDGGLMQKLTDLVDCIYVNRDGNDVQAIKDCMRVLRADGVLNIYPEGTRNRSYDSFLPFKSGAAALSIKAQAPIVPVVKVTKMKVFKKTYAIIGDPIEFRQYYGKKVTKEQIEECDNILREAMWNMRLAFLDKHPIKITPIKEKKKKSKKD